MAFNRRVITKELDNANLAKHNDNYTEIQTELNANASSISSHVTAQSAHGSTSAATAGKIMQRDESGRAKVAAPAASDDIARKAEVDAVQTNLDDHKADASVHLSAADRTKLDGIEDGAEPNQNAFAKVNDVEAASESDALTIEGGTGITVTTNPTTRKVVVTATGDATPGAHGSSHNIDGADPIPDLVTLRSDFDALTPADVQAKVDALAGVGNTKTVKQLADDVAESNTKLASLLKVTDISIDDALTAKSRRNSAGKIRIATFNFEGFRKDDMDIIYRARRYLLNLACDFAGMQETWNGVLRKPEQLQNGFYVYSYFGKSMHNKIVGMNYGTTMISPETLTERSVVLYTMLDSSLEQRSYTKAKVEINGKTITLFNTHLSYEKAEETINQMSQLFNAVVDDGNKYQVITGDFNTDILSHFDVFTSAGYKVCNTNLGSYKGSSKAIDNIIISPSLSLESINMISVDDDVSDHNIIYADISGV